MCAQQRTYCLLKMQFIQFYVLEFIFTCVLWLRQISRMSTWIEFFHFIRYIIFFFFEYFFFFAFVSSCATLSLFVRFRWPNGMKSTLVILVRMKTETGQWNGSSSILNWSDSLGCRWLLWHLSSFNSTNDLTKSERNTNSNVIRYLFSSIFYFCRPFHCD